MTGRKIIICSESEKVKQFVDDERFYVDQGVSIDRSDVEEWVVLEHNGSEISLSDRNFQRLLEMYKKLKEK